MYMQSCQEIKPNDLVIYNEGGGVMAGGFKINTMFSNGSSPMITHNSNSNMTGGSVGSIFSDLAVPAGLLFIQQSYSPKYKFKTSDSVVMPDSMHDRLLSLVTPRQRLHHNVRTHNKRGSKKSGKTRKQK